MVAPREVDNELINNINSYIMSTKGLTTTSVMKHFKIARRTLHKLQADGLIKLPPKMSRSWAAKINKGKTNWRHFSIK